MKNVYLVNLSFGLAGTERRFANIWHTLRARGNVRAILVVPDTLAELLYSANLAERGDPLLWVVRERSWLRALERLGGPVFLRMAVALVRSTVVARAYRPIWRIIAADPDAVIHIGLNCSSLEPPAAPTVYECMDSTLTQLGTRHYAKAAKRRTVIHCQTERIRVALEKVQAAGHPRWMTVTSPCYFASYSSNDGGTVRDPMLVAFVGRLSEEKRPLLFLDAIARTRALGIPVRALMLGEGPLEGAIRACIETLGLHEVVKLGFTSNPTARLASASIYVSLQTGDNYGSQSLLEAMGAGCAIIASDVGETGRLVTPDTGLLVKTGLEPLSAAFTALLTNPAGTRSMGDAARIKALTEYSADRYTAFVESLYELAKAQYRLPEESESSDARVAIPVTAEG